MEHRTCVGAALPWNLALTVAKVCLANAGLSDQAAGLGSTDIPGGVTAGSWWCIRTASGDARSFSTTGV